MAKIKIGDIVTLKGTPGHTMTATGYLTNDTKLKKNQRNLRLPSDVDETYVECFWLTSAGRPHREYFHEDALVVSKTSRRLNGGHKDTNSLEAA